MSNQTSRIKRYDLSNHIGSLFPDTEWGKFFDGLSTFFNKQGVIGLLPIACPQAAEKDRHRLVELDCVNIMRVIIGKTYGYKKPFESLTCTEMARSNDEAGIFIPEISSSTFKLRMKNLLSGQYVKKFSIKNENGHFYTIDLGIIIDAIRPIFAERLENVGINIDKEPKNYQDIEKNLSKEMLSKHKMYIEIFRDNAEKASKLSMIVRRVCPMEFESFKEAKTIITDVVKKVLENSRKTE